MCAHAPKITLIPSTENLAPNPTAPFLENSHSWFICCPSGHYQPCHIPAAYSLEIRDFDVLKDALSGVIFTNSYVIV